jgi:hypothetical protein
VTTHRGPITNCVCCGRTGNRAGRGLVDACYARHKANGTLERYPRVNRARADTAEDYQFLRSQGLADVQIAARLGFNPKYLKSIVRSTSETAARS